MKDDESVKERGSLRASVGSKTEEDCLKKVFVEIFQTLNYRSHVAQPAQVLNSMLGSWYWEKKWRRSLLDLTCVTNLENRPILTLLPPDRISQQSKLLVSVLHLRNA